MAKRIIIQGKHIRDIPSFYEELNRVFMQGEDWTLGQTLDGFNDLLYGGFGLIDSKELIDLVWKDMQFSQAALGYDTTRAYYHEKLAPGSPFDKDLFQIKLNALDAGEGKTYFDIVMEIIADHSNIRLITE